MKKKLIICSGGLDSTAMTLLALNEQNCKVTLLSFNYGQKATDELLQVKRLAERYGVESIVMDISPLKYIFGVNQLTDQSTDVQKEYKSSVVVPLRNALFLQIGMVYAYAHSYDEIVLGSHLDDCEERNGERLFPDCSPEFFKSFELAMDMGTFRADKKVRIVTPSLLGMHKTDLIRAAHEIDDESLFGSWSCYKNGDKQCGVCDSCMNRKKAFELAEIEDRTEYEQ